MNKKRCEKALQNQDNVVVVVLRRQQWNNLTTCGGIQFSLAAPELMTEMQRNL